jgi:hypothetical protein
MRGLDIRFVVTSLDLGSAEWIYDSLYCARGQAENLIKLLLAVDDIAGIVDVQGDGCGLARVAIRLMFSSLHD